MKNRIDLSDSPYINFVKILSAYIFIGVVILAFILAICGYGTPRFDVSKLQINNILEMFLYIFGGLSAFFSAAFTLVFVFSQVFNKVAGRFEWAVGVRSISFMQYWQNVLVIALASATAYGVMAGILHAL